MKVLMRSEQDITVQFWMLIRFCQDKNSRIYPETYVIFITEHDVLKGGLPLYHINRKIEENGMTFCDESHIIYVIAVQLTRQTVK